MFNHSTQLNMQTFLEGQLYYSSNKASLEFNMGLCLWGKSFKELGCRLISCASTVLHSKFKLVHSVLKFNQLGRMFVHKLLVPVISHVIYVAFKTGFLVLYSQCIRKSPLFMLYAHCPFYLLCI